MSASARLRILHTESSLGWGGQEIRVLTEARGVAQRGHDVAIAAPVEARIFHEAPGYGIEAVALPIGRKRIGGMLALRAFLAQRSFDVVNTHSSTDAWLAALACRTLPRAPPIVRTRHISASVARNRATRWLYASACDHIVTTGEKLRLQVLEETGVDAARVVSIPTGVDLGRFRRGDRAAAREATGLPSGAKIVGIVATLRSWKGHRYLLQAIAAMRRPDVLLVIVGDGPQRAALEALAAELRLGDAVRFAANQSDVAPWMQAMDVFCLPSYANEGVPQALMQAMACGLPVVTTPVGSIAEIVTDGVTGLLVPPEDAPRLAQAIASLLDHDARRHELGERAASVAAERFADALMVDRMLEVFERVTAARRG
jgi:glycosyltransferase involved in cell wall biosynthesis